ncbi:MAG: hypothetical protein LBI26_03345 [Holosporales bacterium]|jgi:hypothetical protein|nr:hypothetical protein [Holosporales bacterium]
MASKKIMLLGIFTCSVFFSGDIVAGIIGEAYADPPSLDTEGDSTLPMYNYGEAGSKEKESKARGLSFKGEEEEYDDITYTKEEELEFEKRFEESRKKFKVMYAEMKPILNEIKSNKNDKSKLDKLVENLKSIHEKHGSIGNLPTVFQQYFGLKEDDIDLVNTLLEMVR